MIRVFEMRDGKWVLLTTYDDPAQRQEALDYAKVKHKSDPQGSFKVEVPNENPIYFDDIPF